MRVVIVEDKPDAWAIYSLNKEGQQQAQGDACKKCYDVWNTAFKHMEWDGFVSKYDGEAKFKATVDNAITAFLNPKLEKDFPDADVTKQTWLGLEVHREVVLLTERDMKRLSGERDLSRVTLKQVPSFTIPKEDGDGTEQVWCFKDPAADIRKGTLKISVGSLQREWVLQQNRCLHADQADDMFVSSQKELGQSIGTHDLIEKEQRGNLKLVSWETFMPKLQKERDEDSRDDIDAQVHAMQETEVTLIGPSALKSQFLTPPSADSKKKNPKAPVGGSLQRGSSSQSMGGGSQAGDAAPLNLAAAFAHASSHGGDEASVTIVDESEATGYCRRKIC
eukprot:6491831-Amphidinium_carterae.3